MELTQTKPELKKAITPFMLWGLGVGYVISGMYFGWNIGLKEGGTLGLAIATVFIIIMYVTFSFSYAELACAIPRAGGVFDYASRALGRDAGFIAGIAQNIEFIFSPTAIAFAIGAYFNLFFPQAGILWISVGAYVLFTLLNIYGVRAAASFELIITVIAVIELLVFAGITLPYFRIEHLKTNALPAGWGGILAAIPFAIWFFLGIEGIANVAEETIQPQKNIFRGFSSAILTLVILCVLTFIASVGVNGWEAVVFNAKGDVSDSPLPLALSKITGSGSILFHLLVTIGLFGLVASFHGFILAAGRSTYEFARAGYAPAFVSKIHAKYKTPANALLVNTVIGIIILLSGKTAQIITIAVFGALTLYILSLVSLIVLRVKEPELPRPYKVPFYPLFPILSLVITLVSIITMVYYYFYPAVIYFGLLVVAFVMFKLFYRKNV
jgi:ethanolamine permease